MTPVSKIQEEEEIEEEWEEEVKTVPLKLATEGFSDEDDEDPLTWGVDDEDDGAVILNWEWRKSMICWHWLADITGLEGSADCDEELEKRLAAADW